jgi:hypothetical protein
MGLIQKGVNGVHPLFFGVNPEDLAVSQVSDLR